MKNGMATHILVVLFDMSTPVGINRCDPGVDLGDSVSLFVSCLRGCRFLLLDTAQTMVIITTTTATMTIRMLSTMIVLLLMQNGAARGCCICYGWYQCSLRALPRHIVASLDTSRSVILLLQTREVNHPELWLWVINCRRASMVMIVTGTALKGIRIITSASVTLTIIAALIQDFSMLLDYDCNKHIPRIIIKLYIKPMVPHNSGVIRYIDRPKQPLLSLADNWCSCEYNDF